MEWFLLIIAGLFEVAFVINMKLSDGFKNVKYTILTVISASLSFFLLSLALKDIAVGTGYAVWTGIGAAGSVLLGMYLFQEKKSRKKLFFLSCIIMGVVGLKLFG
ncbi:quaternary ammonium compound-resistance protein SugE [Paenisporosarcina quisquiliarum]|uniref:Multidrug efflux SMR transporter n=1 Tax=Psychrobacillus psychrodurans TaxID=126157 RepID=A0A9X3LAE1_9BACI|nr:multidrug efflux SMR transporter [Psychrobacillus psychrodurans]SEN06951.1 quaternary ammonium compound-resistance protein SugE [Paenisporosarcina quisquiliarum]MCK1997143.1 multidrug efflux SMR transporter [Psychrobacillus psychrodurans]MCZ8534350.1 multidrug efflux SMR transporter [Psychrobacillus psychrodurans]MCZ8541132.1 multidrug efflux SMR transporter [Psychrobacillus psychrodurans]SFM86712.1 quaternary ammonium compound-resistance protein SugE [Psychrobacillus psychrodurans]